METPEIQQRITLSDQLSVIQSSNLRDVLKVRGDDGSAACQNGTLTLAAVLSAEKNSAAPSASSGGRTLLDVIREEEESRSVGGAGVSRWRDLADRLRIRPGATWTAGSASASAQERPDASDRGGSGTIRVSLMTLMEEREEEEGEEEERGRADGVTALTEADVGAEEEEVVVEHVRRQHVCCVCMVTKKGAAFIPCGHTFCRVCSRELLMSRGNCPLCNGSISEVLDIF